MNCAETRGAEFRRNCFCLLEFVQKRFYWSYFLQRKTMTGKHKDLGVESCSSSGVETESVNDEIKNRTVRKNISSSLKNNEEDEENGKEETTTKKSEYSRARNATGDSLELLENSGKPKQTGSGSKTEETEPKKS